MYWLLPSIFSLHNFSRDFMVSSSWYQVFFRHHFAGLLAVFAYVTVMSSAMQVGLAIPQLQGSAGFTNASFGFSITAMVSRAGAAIVILLVWGVLFWYHILSTLRYCRKVEIERKGGARAALEIL
jgi:hypothetical protein